MLDMLQCLSETLHRHERRRRRNPLSSGGCIVVYSMKRHVRSSMPIRQIPLMRNKASWRSIKMRISEKKAHRAGLLPPSLHGLSGKGASCMAQDTGKALSSWSIKGWKRKKTYRFSATANTCRATS